jgi:hypothetical protein
VNRLPLSPHVSHHFAGWPITRLRQLPVLWTRRFMVRKFVEWALDNPLIVVLLAVGLVILGG